MGLLYSFLYFWSLKTGTIIAAILTLLVSIFLWTLGFILLYDPDLAGATRHNHVVLGGFYITLGAILFICFILMVVALLQCRPVLLLPWIICAMLEIIVFLFVIVFLAVNGLYFALLGLIFVVFFLYLWIVVHSYYMFEDKGYVPP